MNLLNEGLDMKKISQGAICIGVLTCILGAIWSPEEWIKWILSAIYLIVVGKYFGVTFRTEKVRGTKIKRSDFELKDFHRLRDMPRK